MNDELVKAVQAGKAQPVELWMEMKRFILSIANKYRGKADIDDLMQESYFGLLTAINLYDPNKGASFSSYAYFWINNIMVRYVNNCCHAVRLPEHSRWNAIRYRRTISDFKRDVGRKPTDQELCEALSMDRSQLEQVRAADAMMNAVGLDSPIGENQDKTVAELIPCDIDIENEVIDKIQKEELKTVLWKCVDALPEKQAQTLRQHYQDGQTLQEISEGMGVTTQRVQQMEAAALRTLRKKQVTDQIAPFMNDLRYSLGVKTGRNPTERAALKVGDYFQQLHDDGLI